MDFHNMKRKQLQSLCKKHGIPANLSNSQMAINLSSLLQEKERPTKRGRASSKTSIETDVENDSSITTRQSKKVRFSPTNETFEYVELRSGRKKMKVTQTKSALKAVAKERGKSVEKVDVRSNKKVNDKPVRSLRSRVQGTMEGGAISVTNPPVGIKRGGRVGKYADDAEFTEETVIKPTRGARSSRQTSSEGGSVLVPKQKVEKKKGKRGAVGKVDGIEPVEDNSSFPVRTTRSRAQVSIGGKHAASNLKVEKGISPRGVVVNVEPAKDMADVPVRTTRLRAQTLKVSGLSTMPNLLIEKKRARKGSKFGDTTIQSNLEVLDSTDNVFSSKAASEEAQDLPPKRPLRKRELGSVEMKEGKNMRQKTEKGRCEDFEEQRLINDSAIKEPDLCLRRSSRNVIHAKGATISKRNSDETEMVGRGGNTRSRSSRNQLVKEDSYRRTEATIVEQRKIEVVQQVESSGRTGRNANQRKSILSQKTGNVVESQGGSEVPLLEEPKKRPARRGNKRNSVVCKIDEVKSSELKAEKGDFLKENEIVVPHTSPLRRSMRQTSLLEPISSTDEDLAKRSSNQSLLVSGGTTAVGNNKPKKQRGGLNIEEPVVDMQAAHSVDKSSRRFTRSVTKSVGNLISSALEKSAGKKKQQKAVIPNSLVATPSEAQVSMPEVTEISKNLISGSTPVTEDNSSKKRYKQQNKYSLKQEGNREVSAKPSMLEQEKGQTSVVKTKKFQVNVGEREEISARKRRGDHLFEEDRLGTSPKRFTRSSTKPETKTKLNYPDNSAGKNMLRSTSRPPKLAVDGDSAVSAGKGITSIDNEFAMREVHRSPPDLFSGSTGVVKSGSSVRTTKSSRSTRSSRQDDLQEVQAGASNADEVKSQLSSMSRKLRTDDRQVHKGISCQKDGEKTTKDLDVVMKFTSPVDKSSRRLTRSSFKSNSNAANNLSRKSVGKKKFKNRSEITFEEVDDGMKSSPPIEESSRRLTGSSLKSNSNAASNLTGKSIAKEKFKNSSETPRPEVKTPSSDGSLVVHGLASVSSAQISLPEAVRSASDPAKEVIDGTSSKMRENLSNSACELNSDGKEEVCTKISNIANDKDQASNLEETLASESERLQMDDKEKDNVVSVEEAKIITESVNAFGDSPAHVINGLATTTAFLGMPNLDMEISIEEGTSAHSLCILPEVLDSVTEQSIEIEPTGQYSARESAGASGMRESESVDFEIEVPLEEGTSDLRGEHNIAEKKKSSQCSTEMVNERSPGSHSLAHSGHSSELAEQKVMETLSATADDSFDGTTSTAVGCLVGEQSHSLYVTKEMQEPSIDAQSSPAASDVLVRDIAENVNTVPGVAKETSSQCSTEMVKGHSPGSHSLARSGHSSELAEQKVMETLSATADDSFDGTTSTTVGGLVVEQSHSLHETKEMQEPSTDAQPRTAASDVFAADIAENVNIVHGVDKETSSQCSAEMVKGYSPGSHLLARSGRPSELAEQEVMENMSATADDSFDRTTSTVVGRLVVEQSHSLYETKEMHEPSTDALPSPAASDVFVRDTAENVYNFPGVDKETSSQCSAEMVKGHSPGSHLPARSGRPSDLAEQEVMETLSATADDSFDGTTSTAVGCLVVEQSHSLYETKEMQDPSTDAQPSPAASDVFGADIAENVNIVHGVDKETSSHCSAEMVKRHSPGSHLPARSGRPSDLAEQEVMETLSATADDSFDGTTSTAVGCLVVEQSHSLYETKEMHEPSTDAQPRPAASDVFVRDTAENVYIVPGVDKETSSQCSSEMVKRHSPGSHLPERSGCPSELAEQEVMEILSATADDSFDRTNSTAVGCLVLEESHSLYETKEMPELSTDAQPSTAASDMYDRDSGVDCLNDQRSALSVDCNNSSKETSGDTFVEDDLDASVKPENSENHELPIPESIYSTNTPPRSSEKPCGSFDGTVVVSAIKSCSDKQNCSVKVCSGPSSDEIVDVVDMNREKTKDLNLQILQSEHHLAELDQGLEEKSADHNHNSDYAEILKSSIFGGSIPVTVHSDVFVSAAKDDFTSCRVEQKFVESSELDDCAQRKSGEITLNSTGEISGSGSLTREKHREVLLMNDSHGKTSNMGAHMDNNDIDSPRTGEVSKEVVDHRSDVEELPDTYPAEKSHHDECTSKEISLQVSCEKMTDWIPSESEHDYKLQMIFGTSAPKDVKEFSDTVQEEESRHDKLHTNDNQLQCEEDYQHQKLFESPLSDTQKSEDRVPEVEYQPENSPNKEDQIQRKGNAQLSSCEDIYYGDLWHDTLPTLFATPASSSQNARSYCHENTPDIAFSDNKTQDIISVEIPSNHYESNLENVAVSKYNAFTASSVSNFGGEDRTQEFQMDSEMTSIKVSENSSVSAEKQSSEPEDHMNQIYFCGFDRSVYKDNEHSGGFDEDGDTEQYFHSENADLDNFGGITQENLANATEMSCHDYTAAFDLAEVKGEVNMIEADNSVGDENDKTVIGLNRDERDNKQPEMKPSDKSARTEAPPDTTPISDPSVSVNFDMPPKFL